MAHSLKMGVSSTRWILVLCVTFFLSLVASAPIDLKTILTQLQQDGACVSNALHDVYTADGLQCSALR
jgi:hypothetical protein